MSDSATEAPEPLPPPTQVPEPPRRRGGAAVAAALAVVAIVVLVALSPFWAPALTTLLPWAAPPAADATATATLAARLDQLQAAQNALSQSLASTAALSALDKRVATLESRPPPPPPDLSGIEQQIAAANATVGALGSRLAALEKTVQAQEKGDPTDAALALVALQIGEAVQAGRPFPDEYRTFAGLARARPDLAAAAAPLAGPAKTGVASDAALARDLHALGAALAAPAPPPQADDWRGRIIARLRSLVTIRRVDAAGDTPAEAAVRAAGKALAAGDLAGAAAALRKLSGGDADTVRPWLQAATARLQAEAGLHAIATLLAAHLGAPPAATLPG